MSIIDRVTEVMTRRKILIAKRWWDIFFYSILSAVITWLVLAPLVDSFVGHVGLNTVTGLLAFGVLWGSIVMGIFIEFRLCHFKFWEKEFWAHPPLWFAAALALVWLTQPYMIWVYAGTIAFGLMVVFLVLGRVKPSGREMENLVCLESLRQDVVQWSSQDILQWANQELPLFSKGKSQFSDKTALLFNHEKLVQRIYNRLFFESKLGREPKSLALIGEYGSGKSSIINALIAQISNSNWLVVTVDAWARDGNNIDEQILDLVIDKVGEHADVSGYRRLPSQYRAALQSHGGWWSFFSHLSGGESGTKAKLKSIDDLLLVLNKRLLIVIEDPDRGVKSEVDRRKERVLALIDRLQQFTGNRVKVIISGGKALLGEDYRVVEFKEELAVPSKAYADVLNKLVSTLWCTKGDALVMPNGVPVFTQADLPFGTPRDFKHVIRDVSALWQTDELKGEIDLKSLVMLSFAKERFEESILYFKLLINESRGRNTFNRHFYHWSGFSGYISASVDEANVQKIMNNNDASVDSSQVAESLGLRLSLGVEKSREMKGWVKRINECDGFQVVRSFGRNDYYQRFIARSVLPTCAIDVDASSLNAYETLSDQEYLGAMEAVFNCLKAEEVLLGEDVKRLIYAGQLSPYLYRRMAGKDVAESQYEVKSVFGSEQKALQAYKKLADKIIELMPGLPYTPNSEGHPAGRHLIEIVECMLKLADGEQLALDVCRYAVQASSEAGGDLFYRGYTLYRNDFEVKSKDRWVLFALALTNINIVHDDFSVSKKINWNFLYSFQDPSRANGQELWWMSTLKNTIGVSSDAGEKFCLIDSFDRSAAEAAEAAVRILGALIEEGKMPMDYDSDSPRHRAIYRHDKDRLGEELSKLNVWLYGR